MFLWVWLSMYVHVKRPSVPLKSWGVVGVRVICECVLCGVNYGTWVLRENICSESSSVKMEFLTHTCVRRGVERQQRLGSFCFGFLPRCKRITPRCDGHGLQSLQQCFSARLQFWKRKKKSHIVSSGRWCQRITAAKTRDAFQRAATRC